MRALKQLEINQRGCHYCADRESRYRCEGHTESICHHDVCPYHELDDVKDYHEYIKKTEDSGLARALRELAKE